MHRSTAAVAPVLGAVAPSGVLTPEVLVALPVGNHKGFPPRALPPVLHLSPVDQLLLLAAPGYGQRLEDRCYRTWHPVLSPTLD